MGETILLGTELLLIAAYLWASDADDEEVLVEEIPGPLSLLTPPPSMLELPA